MTKDRLKPLERLAAYNRGGPVDRLPCVPVVGNGAARVIGARVSELRSNGRLLAEAHIAAYRRFGYDGIRVFTDLYVQAEATGAKVRVPLDETAYLDSPAISDVAAIDSLSPPDPRRDGHLPQQLEAMERVLEAVGGEVPVSGAVTAPFTNATFLIGTEYFIRLTRKNPDAVHRLCEISLQTGLEFAKAILAIGVTPSLTDPMSSSTVISPRTFLEFSFPYLKRLIDFIHAGEKPVTLHICGKTHPIWQYMADAGADCLSIDNDANLRNAKVAVGNRVRLMGNVPPSAVMFQGTAGEVREAVRQCVAQAWDNPKGYIVASGCSLPTETPFSNIDAMLEAVREIGYPVNAAALGNGE